MLLAAALCMLMAACGEQAEPDMLASARSFLDKKDAPAAIVQLKSVLQKYPNSGEGRYLLGSALLAANDPAGAVLELEKARAAKHRDSDVLPALAKALSATGQAKKVTDGFAQTVLDDPKAAAELKAAVATAFLAQGQLDKGDAATQAALQFDPTNVAARFLQVRLTAGRGAVDEAMPLLDKLLAEDPKRADAWQLKGELLWLGKADLEGGIKAMREALVVNPRYLPAHLALIRVMLQKRDIDGFKAQIAELKKALPNQIETMYFEAQLAFLNQDLERAREGAQQLLRIAPESPLVRQLAGAIEAQKGALRVAENHLNRALQLMPELPLARRLLAETHLRAGQPAKALATIRPLVESPKPEGEVLAIAAEAYLQLGDMAKSEALYGLAAKVNPDDAKARTALALTQLQKGNYDLGFAQLESVAATDKGSYADLALISSRLRRNETDAALRAIEKLQAKQPDKPLAPLLRARIMAQRKDFAATRVNLEKAVALDPVFLPAVVDLANLDMEDKRPADALKRFDASLAREPKNARALLAIIDIRRRSGAKPEEIDELLVDAVAANAGEPQPRFALIEHRLSQRQIKSAISAAQDAVAALPDDMQLLDALGRVQLANGNIQQAVGTFRKVAVANPTIPQPQMRLAEAFVAGKDFVAARQSLRSALDIAPNMAAAQRALVHLALIEKRVDEALKIAQGIQKQRPKDPFGYILEGDIHMSLRAWDAAISSFKASFERSRTTEMAGRLHSTYLTAGRLPDAEQFAEVWLKEFPRDLTFLFHLGSMAIERKDYVNAELRFRQINAIQPDDAAVLNNLSWLLVEQGKPGGLAFAERANQLRPNQAPVMDSMAKALVAENQIDKAIEWQRKAVALSPDALNYQLHLGKLLIKANQKEAARTVLESLAQLGAKDANHAEVSALLKGL